MYYGKWLLTSTVSNHLCPSAGASDKTWGWVLVGPSRNGSYLEQMNKEDWSGRINVDIYQCRQLLRHGCYPRPRQSCNTCKRKVTNKPSYLFQRRTNCWERGYFESINLNILLGREGEVAKSLLNPCNSHLGENLKKMRNHKDQLLPGELLHSEKSQDQFCKPIKQEIRP